MSAKEHLLASGGGISGNIMTPRRLAERSYDLLGMETPVIDLSSRELIIRKIMKKEELPSLKRSGSVRDRMTRYISVEIGSLIQGGVDPTVLSGGRKGDLGRVLSCYLEELEKRDLLDPEQVPFAVAREIEDGRRLPWSNMGIYMLGDQPVSYKTLIDSFSKRMESLTVFEHGSRTGTTVPYDIPSRERRGRLALEFDGKVQALKSATPWEEIESIARHIKKRLQDPELNPWDVSVVFPSRRKYDPLVKVLFGRYGLPIEMGKDLRLDSVPSVKVAYDLLRSYRDCYPREILLKSLSSGLIGLPGECRVMDLERITRDSFITGGGRNAAGEWIDGLLEVSQNEEKDERTRKQAADWSNFLNDLLSRLEILSKGKKPVKERCRELKALIRFLKISEMTQDLDDETERINLNGLDRFMERLRSIIRRSSLLKIKSCDMEEFIFLISQELEKEKISTIPRGRGVQILGLEGAAGLDFGLCVVASLNSGDMPSSPSGFRIISERERIDLGMEEVKRRRKELEELSMVLSSTEEVILSFHEEEGGRPVMVSPFVEKLDLDYLRPEEELLCPTDVARRIGELSDPSFHLYDKRTGDIDELLYDREAMIGMLEDDLGERIRRGILGRWMRCSSTGNPFKGSVMEDSHIEMLRSRFGHDHVWSPSRLETYRECPYGFFSRYVLGLKEREDLEPGVPPERKGLIFHSIAERFYRKWMSTGKTRLLRENLPRAREIMKEVSLEVLMEHPYHGPYWDALKDLLLGAEEEEGLMDEFLRVEASYPGLFEVHDTEMKFGPLGGGEPVKLNLPGQDEGPDYFLMQGSIDRVDRLSTSAGDIFYIWDYKTGRSDIPEDSLQVPLYLSALRKLDPDVFPGGGGYYYIRRKGSVKRDPVLGRETWEMREFIKDRTIRDVESLSGRMRDDITTSLEIIDSIRCGDFLPEQTCRSRHCPYVDICRKGEIQ